MNETDYRIEYSIQRKRHDDEDFVEIGFGSSCDYGDIESAIEHVASDIDNLNWEHTREQPSPKAVDAEIRNEQDHE